MVSKLWIEKGLIEIGKKILWLCMLIQIVMGAVWIAGNLWNVWTADAAGMLAHDGMWVQDGTGTWAGMVMRAGMVLQLLAACASCIYFMKQVTGNMTKAVLGGLYLLTLPLTVQYHITGFGASLRNSCLLLVLALCIRGYRKAVSQEVPHKKRSKNQNKNYRNENHWDKNHQKRNYKSWGFLLAALILIVGISLAARSQDPSLPQSLGEAMVSRFVWPDFGKDYYFWPEEIKSLYSEEQAANLDTAADLVQSSFVPAVKAAYGQEKAEQLFIQMAVQSLNLRTREKIAALATDFAAYLNPLWRIRDQFTGKITTLSYSGWNYEKMRTYMPEWTKAYMSFGLLFYRFMLIIAFLLGLHHIRKHEAECRRNLPLYLFFSLFFLIQVTLNTLSGAGTMDYARAQIIVILCGVPIPITASTKSAL